jgi:hypothetical protein
MTDLSEIEVRRRRAARNQSLFREVNERIEDLSSPASFAGFVCECMNESCDERVRLTVHEYEHIRAGANRFLVLPGHQVPEVEETVETRDRYLVVAKLGSGEDVAESLDPRRRELSS